MELRDFQNAAQEPEEDTVIKGKVSVISNILDRDLVQWLEGAVYSAFVEASENPAKTVKVSIALVAAWDEDEGGVLCKVTETDASTVKRVARLVNGQMRLEMV